MEKTCENCGYGPRSMGEGMSCDMFCSIMNDPRQDCLWEPDTKTVEEVLKDALNGRR
jgi:hypothetical protein